MMKLLVANGHDRGGTELSFDANATVHHTHDGQAVAGENSPAPAEAIMVNDDDAPRVLLVDDEPLVRSVLSRVLRRSGFEVIQVESAEQALLHLACNEVEVVLADVGLPGMSGTQLALDLSRSRPGLRVVLISGDADGVQDELGGAFTCLQKPIEFAFLAATLHATASQPAWLHQA